MNELAINNAMTEERETALRIADLGTLLCSRICHDIAGPVGAIDNSLDFIEDGASETVRKQAAGLLRDSARFLSRSIRFYRLAFGASVGASSIRLDGARSITCEYYDSTRYNLTWPEGMPQGCNLDKLSIKAMVNIVYFVASFLPRYGDITVQLNRQGDVLKVGVTGSGPRVQVPGSLTNLSELMENPLASSPVNLSEAQVYLLVLLVRACGGNMRVEAATEIENSPVHVEALLPLV